MLAYVCNKHCSLSRVGILFFYLHVEQLYLHFPVKTTIISPRWESTVYLLYELNLHRLTTLLNHARLFFTTLLTTLSYQCLLLHCTALHFDGERRNKKKKREQLIQPPSPRKIRTWWWHEKGRKTTGRKTPLCKPASSQSSPLISLDPFLSQPPSKNYANELTQAHCWLFCL